MKQLIISTYLFISMLSCSPAQSKRIFFDSSIQTDSLNVPLDSKQYYFPEALFPQVIPHYVKEGGNPIDLEIQEGTVDDFVLSWYSEHLHAMKEPLLFNRPLGKEVYRFTWLRTFHHPFMVRIEKEKDKYTLYWKELDGAGGYAPGSIITYKSKSISRSEWKEFTSKLDEFQFWKTPIGKANWNEDGAEWILEGSTSEHYHVVTSCDYPCMYLLSLTGMDIPENEIY